MNSGGLIEGLKKCYKGKNLAKKHVFLYLLAFVITYPIAYATLKTGGNETYAQLYILQNPLFLILIFAASLVFGFYFIKFLHNAIKLFIWQDTQNNQERVNAMEIMPEINTDIFKNWWSVVKFGLIWCLIILLTITIFAFLCRIQFINFLFIPILYVVIVCMLFSFPYIIAGFARNYDTKGNVSPSLMITLVPKVFIPATILGLKYFVFLICIAIIQSIVVGVLAGVFALLKINTTTIGLSLLTSIFVYTEFISTLVFYYAVANIYYRKIELEREI